VIGRLLGVMDRPDGGRKLHREATLMVGGLALALPLLILQVTWLAGHPNQERLFIALIIATAGFWLLGFVDDRRGLRPLTRLFASFLLFGTILMVEPKMAIRTIDLGAGLPRWDLGVLGIPFTMLCLAGVLNAINMADGRNGLVLGIAVCWAYGLGEYAHLHFQPFMHFLLISLVTVLIYNWSGRLFLGDAGSYVIGALLGLLTIYLYNEPRSEFPMAAAALWLMVPVLDCLRLIVHRLSVGRSPFSADLHHLHHYLSSRLPWRIALPLYLMVSAGPGFLALLWPASAFALLLLMPVLYLTLLAWLRRPSLLATAAQPLQRVLPLAAPAVRRARRHGRNRLLLVANDARFLVSHRLPLALAARESGYDVHIAAYPDDAVPIVERHGLPFHPIQFDRTGTSPLRDARTIWQFAGVVRNVAPQILHCVTIKPVVYGGLVARRLGVPGYVAAVSGLGQMFDANGPGSNLARELLHPLYRTALAHRNSRTIFQNRDDLDEFVAAGLVDPGRAALILGSGVDPAIFRPAPEEPGDPVVLLSGRLLWAKGVAVFAEAAAILRASGIGARFALAGAPPSHQPDAVPLEAIRAWEREGVLEWWGYHDDMPRIYDRCHIVCLPTHYREGVPKALIEAAASGRPIVTTDTAGCREICRDGRNGLLVPPRDPVALADALRRLIADGRLRRAMGMAGRRVAVAEFALAGVIERTLAIYRLLQAEAPVETAFEPAMLAANSPTVAPMKRSRA
jgi:glycosyltransferase involved in cell wall biosynthesis